jgi:hypothetical protein
MPSWNPFDWVDDGLDAAGEAWDAVKDSFTNLVQSGGKTIFKSDVAGQVLTQQTGQLVSPAYKAVKGTTRALTTTLDFPLQVLNNTMAFSYNNPYLRATIPVLPQTGKGFKKAEASTLEQFVGIVRNTTLGETLADALPGGEKVDLGSGFFPGGDTVKDVNDRKRELMPTLYGSTFTVGRSFAAQLADNGVIEPGSTAYSVISGAIDAGWAMTADPVNWVPAGTVAEIGNVVLPLTAAARAGKRAKVTTNLSKKAAKILEKGAQEGKVVMDAAGLIDNGRRTVNPNNWEAFKITKRGKTWLENFVGPESGTAAEIWRRSNKTIPPSTAKKLADANTLDEVVAALDDAVYTADPLTHVRIMPGIDPRPIVTRVGATIKGNASRYRPFFDTLPEATDFPLNNPVKAIENADGVMAVLEVPLEKRNGLLNELFDLMDGNDNKAIFDWLNKFENDVVASQLKKWDYTDDEIKRIASWRQRYEETVSGYVTDSAGSSVPLEWLIGGPQGGYGPLLLSQILKVNPVLIDPTDLRQIADRLGPIRSRLEKMRRSVIETSVDPKTGEVIVEKTAKRGLVNTPVAITEGIGDLTDYLQARAWKPNILLRPRYLIRVLPEEMLRVSASGLFEHPWQYIAQIMTNRNSIDAFGNVIITSRKAAKIEAQANEAGRVLAKLNKLQDAGETTYGGRAIADLIAERQDEIAGLNAQLDIFDERIAKMLPGVDDALLRGMPRKTQDLLLHPSAISGMIKRGELVSVERAVKPDLWSKAMAQRLAERASNAYYRSLAKAVKDGQTVEQITTRFASGDLKQFLDRYRQQIGNLDPNYVWDRNGIKNFVQKNIDDLNIYTMNGDPDLLDAVITNSFNNDALSGARGYQGLAVKAKRGTETAGWEPNKALKKYFKDKYSVDPNAPARVNYFPSIYDTDTSLKTVVGRMTARYDALLGLFWDGMYGTSSDLLARNPLWQQSKWQRVIELIPVMAPDEAAKLADNIRNTNLMQSLKADILELAPTARGEMTIDDVEQLAELYAIRNTKETLFDASRKTKFGAAHRKMFPFYDAFVELTGSALKLATNPKVLHKVDKVLGEMRQNTFAGSDLNGDGKKESFLYRDPVSGQEMYAFAPRGGFLKDWRKLGLDFKLGNTLNSLSMISTPYPGLSPFVAVPVNAMLPDATEFDKLRDLIAPYGVPQLDDPSILQYLVPGASEQVQRILGSSGLELFSKVDDRQKAIQSVIRAMQVVATVKDYDPVTPGMQGPTGQESLEQWQNDGKELGIKIYGLTGWAGLFMPGAPIAQWSAKTKQGNVLISVLSQRWSQIDKEGDKMKLDYQDKLEQFIEEFGSENLLAFLQPITERSITGSNSSREYYDWYRRNKETVDKYPDVGGYFSPKSGELDPDVWNIQKLSGDVEYKDPEEFAKRVESAVANFIFNRNVRQFEDSIPPADRGTKKADRALTAEKKRLAEGLVKAYPNWDRATAATQAQKERQLQMDQIRKFVEEPSQQDNPVVKVARDYLDFRDQNLQYILDNTRKVTEDNWKTLKANNAAVLLRKVLWDEGERLATENPAFVNLWQNVLSREFLSVDTEE